MKIIFDVNGEGLKKYLDSEGVRIQPEDNGYFTVHLSWIKGLEKYMIAEDAVAYALRHTSVGRIFGTPDIVGR